MTNDQSGGRAVLIRLHPDQHDAVAKFANEEDRSVASWVRLAVQRRLEAMAAR